MHRHDEEALEFDVTSCRFAEFFRALGEPELGALLICQTDFDIAAVSEGEVSLDRAQTLMQGARSCTFRYRFAPRLSGAMSRSRKLPPGRQLRSVISTSC